MDKQILHNSADLALAVGVVVVGGRVGRALTRSAVGELAALSTS